MKGAKLIAVGDISLGSSKVKMMKNIEKMNPFIFVSEELRRGDIIFGNLERPFSNRGKPQKNEWCLYSPPETVNSLKYAGFNLLSLANNHIFDYGYEGFEDTVAFLKQNNIFCFGAGKNLEEAQKPAIISINDISIGFLGYEWEFMESVNATNNNFGTAPLREEIILEDVKNLKEKADVIVVSLHWGYDRERYPSPGQRKLAHRLVDVGTDLVLGHHPHVLQGIEYYKDGIIAYSLGNFVFLDESYFKGWKGVNRESAILKCQISKSGLEETEIIPINCNDSLLPKPLKDKRKKAALSKLKGLSNGFQAKDYATFWRRNRVRKDLPDLISFNRSTVIDFGIALFSARIPLRKRLFRLFKAGKYLARLH